MDNETKMVAVIVTAICMVVLIVNISLRVNGWLVLQKFKGLSGKALEYELCMHSSDYSSRVLCLDVLKESGK